MATTVCLSGGGKVQWVEKEEKYFCRQRLGRVFTEERKKHYISKLAGRGREKKRHELIKGTKSAGIECLEGEGELLP